MTTTDLIAFGQRNIRLIGAWAVAVVILLVMNYRYTDTTVTFMGVADARESVISFERPVQIKRIHVLSGERVTKGQLLIELSQAELDLEFAQIQTRLNALEAEKTINEAFIGAVDSKGAPLSTPIDEEIKGLKEQLDILERSSHNSYIFAEMDGVVGSVHFKAGEKVSPFSPVMTVSSTTPVSIQGFIHENLHHQIQLGSKVEIISESDKGKKIQGTVTSIGSRIVAFPARLLKYQTAQVWGKEILVSIDSRNEFLLGEKVQIKQGKDGANTIVDLNPKLEKPKDQARFEEVDDFLEEGSEK